MYRLRKDLINIFWMLLFYVQSLSASTQRFYNVHTTFLTFQQRRNKVVSTLCLGLEKQICQTTSIEIEKTCIFLITHTKLIIICLSSNGRIINIARRFIWSITIETLNLNLKFCFQASILDYTSKLGKKKIPADHKTLSPNSEFLIEFRFSIKAICRLRVRQHFTNRLCRMNHKNHFRCRVVLISVDPKSLSL